MTPEEQNNLVDMVAQAVIDRIEQHEQVNQLADMVVARVIELQLAENADSAKQDKAEQDAATNA